MQLLPIITDDISKGELKAAVLETIENIKENGNVLEVNDLLSKIEFFIKELKANKDFTEYAREEVAKFGKEVTLPSGTKIELAEVGVKYDYSKCNDPMLREMEMDLEAAENKLKARQQWLKCLPDDGVQIVTNDGELVQIYPASKSSTSSIKTFLPK